MVDRNERLQKRKIPPIWVGGFGHLRRIDVGHTLSRVVSRGIHGLLDALQKASDLRVIHLAHTHEETLVVLEVAGTHSGGRSVGGEKEGQETPDRTTDALPDITCDLVVALLEKREIFFCHHTIHLHQLGLVRGRTAGGENPAKLVEGRWREGVLE